MNQEECICALATPAGGAIGIIRLSGSDAITLTDKIFQSANGKSLEEAKPYTLHYGEIKDKDGNTIDDVLVSVFRAPTVIQARIPPKFPVTAAGTFFSRFSIALRK